MTSKMNRLIESLPDGTTIQLVFEDGRYDFYPDSNYFKPYFETNTYDVNPKRLGIFVSGKKDIIFEGNGAEFVFHGHIQPITLERSENVTIRNMSIDWDVPLTAEAKVVAADNLHVQLEIDPEQFPYRVENNQLVFFGDDWEEGWRVSGGSWLIEFTPDHIIPAATGDFGCFNGALDEVQYREVKPGLVELKGEFTKTPAVGNYLVLRHSTRDHAGMFFFHSKNIRLEDVSIYHTAGLGVLSQYSENLHFERTEMVPNPDKNRYLSGHDDGFHFMGCKGHVQVENCRFQGLMDDPINIHGTCVPVVERVSDTVLRCQFAHGMSCGLLWGQPGDNVGFIDRETMHTFATRELATFESIDKDNFLLTFREPIPQQVEVGVALENLTWTPSVTIRDCFVGCCRARGFLLSTPGKTLVENNTFETSGSAILIAGDANQWYESGAVTDVTIRDNVFRASCNSSPYQFCEAVISIYPEVPQPDFHQPFHKKIVIENNTFEVADYPVLYAVSVDQLVFRENSVQRSHAYEPWHPRRHTFTLDACKNVEITKNLIGNEVLGKNIRLIRMPASELQVENSEDLKIDVEPK